MAELERPRATEKGALERTQEQAARNRASLGEVFAFEERVKTLGSEKEARKSNPRSGKGIQFCKERIA